MPGSLRGCATRSTLSDEKKPRKENQKGEFRRDEEGQSIQCRNKRGYKVTSKKRENKKFKSEISVGEIRWLVRGQRKTRHILVIYTYRLPSINMYSNMEIYYKTILYII